MDVERLAEVVSGGRVTSDSEAWGKGQLGYLFLSEQQCRWAWLHVRFL